MGSVGMDTAPARMISSAQTVAKMGRRMKNSTIRGRPSLRLRGHRDAVAQELGAGDDHPVAFLDPLQHDVVVAHDLSHLDRLLPRDEAVLLLLGHEREVLAADA